MICAVVPAAGRSVRMGQQKLLLPIGGRPMISRIVDEVLRSPVNSTTVVLGPDAHAVRNALDTSESSSPSPPLKERAGERRPFSHSTSRQLLGGDVEKRSYNQLSFVTNSNPEGDMLSSVRCGLRALPNDCEAVVIALGDQPGVTASLIERLIEMFRSSKGAIIVPVHNGKRGHPLLFSAKYRDEVLLKYDGLGLHALLDAYPAEVVEVETGSQNNFQDLDTLQDYERYIRETKF